MAEQVSQIQFIAWFETLRKDDVPRVGGKNASLRGAHAGSVKIGICGQAPSNYPEFAGFLVEHGIDSISLNPDSFVAATRYVAQTEKRLAEKAAKAA